MVILEVTKETPNRQQKVADVLASAKKAVVITGAGISTSCGIPDFRSAKGLYSLISAEHSAHLSGSSTRQAQTQFKGKELFDSSLWKSEHSTSVFYTFIASLRRKIHDDVKEVSGTHKFIKHLRDQRRLVRCYTQNIDGLERRTTLCMDLRRGKGNRKRFHSKSVQNPIPPSNILPGSDHDGGCEVIQLHGDINALRCTLCQETFNWDAEEREAILQKGHAPECGTCITKDQDRRDRGMRGISRGHLRPDIVLYGEENPAADSIGQITTHDLGLAPDLLLVMGTSLKVHGLKVLVKEFAKAVKKKGEKGKVIFINRTPPCESVWADFIDYWVAMDCDEWVAEVRKLRPDSWLRQEELKLEKRPAKKSGNTSMKRQKADGELPKFDPEEKENLSSTVWNSPDLEHIKPLSIHCQIEEAAVAKRKRMPNAPPGTPSQPKQLLTPPTSRHTTAGGKRSRTVFEVADDATAIQDTPSKKRPNGFDIWEDGK